MVKVYEALTHFEALLNDVADLLIVTSGFCFRIKEELKIRDLAIVKLAIHRSGRNFLRPRLKYEHSIPMISI